MHIYQVPIFWLKKEKQILWKLGKFTWSQNLQDLSHEALQKGNEISQCKQM